jgi:hypothetical protein
VNNKTSAALLFLASFALYSITRSPALDHHHSVQLAMGVLDFNIYWKHPAVTIYLLDRPSP